MLGEIDVEGGVGECAGLNDAMIRFWNRQPTIERPNFGFLVPRGDVSDLGC